MSWLIKLFGSKRLVAAVAAILATVLVPILNRTLHFGLDPAEVQATLVGVLTAALSFIASQWHIDVSTGGESTTAAAIAREAARAAAALLPAKTVGAQVANALAEALADPSTGPQLAQLVASKLPASPPVAPRP